MLQINPLLQSLKGIFPIINIYKFSAPLIYFKTEYISHQIKNRSHTENWNIDC